MENSPVTLDFSKAQPLDNAPPGGVSLDFSKAQPVDGQPAKPTGPTISAEPQNTDDFAYSNDPLKSAGQHLTMPLVKALVTIHDKLRDVQNLTQEGQAEHPIQAHIGDLANKIEGLLTGSTGHGENIGTGKYGILTNPVTGSLLPGGEGAPVAAEAIEGGVNALKGGAAAIKEAVSGGGEAADAANAATHVYDPKTGVIQKIKQAVSPEAASQPGAQTALRSGAASSAEDAAGTAGLKNVRVRPSSGGVRTLLDEPIAALAKTEGATYDAVNEAAGTDLKSLYDHAEEVQDALDDPTNIAQKTSLQAELKTTQDQIAQGEASATKNGVDPSTIDKAQSMTQQRYAMQTVKQKLFNNESVVNGNLAHGDTEVINVDSAIRNAENLDKPSRFAPEGTPTRLQQALGKDGAFKLKQGLYDAQKAGQKVLTRSKVLSIAAGGGVTIGGLLKLISH